MDAVDFIKTRYRMCKNYPDCLCCPFNINNNETHTFCGDYIENNPEMAVYKIEKWFKEHPKEN